MTELLRLALLATVGTVGFSILFHLPPKRLFVVVIGAFCTSMIQLLCDAHMTQAFTGALLATLFAVWFSELFARLLRTPAIVLLTPILIPLVPGGSLFYTMQSILLSDAAQIRKYAIETAQVGFGIAFGTLVAMSIVRFFTETMFCKNKSRPD